MDRELEMKQREKKRKKEGDVAALPRGDPRGIRRSCVLALRCNAHDAQYQFIQLIESTKDRGLLPQTNHLLQLSKVLPHLVFMLTDCC